MKVIKSLVPNLQEKQLPFLRIKLVVYIIRLQNIAEFKRWAGFFKHFQSFLRYVKATLNI